MGDPERVSQSSACSCILVHVGCLLPLLPALRFGKFLLKSGVISLISIYFQGVCHQHGMLLTSVFPLESRCLIYLCMNVVKLYLGSGCVDSERIHYE